MALNIYDVTYWNALEMKQTQLFALAESEEQIKKGVDETCSYLYRTTYELPGIDTLAIKIVRADIKLPYEIHMVI